MIYIEVEDSKDGLKLCEKIREIYFNNYECIKVESFNGIFKLKDKIEDLILSTTELDNILVVFDNIIENPIIERNFNQTINYLDDNNLGDRIIWVPTKSFELEVLSIYGIEFLCNAKAYSDYFWQLRDILDRTHNISDLTYETKKNPLYDNMYNKVRKNKKTRGEYKRLSSEDFERAITIESISKDIMKKVFLNAGDIRPIRDCWVNNCCYKSKLKCNYGNINVEHIMENEKDGQQLYKLRALIKDTSYEKIVKCVDKILGTHTELNVEIIDLISEQIILGNYINKRELKNNDKNNNKKRSDTRTVTKGI
jgi:hypothetical protein